MQQSMLLYKRNHVIKGNANQARNQRWATGQLPHPEILKIMLSCQVQYNHFTAPIIVQQQAPPPRKVSWFRSRGKL